MTRYSYACEEDRRLINRAFNNLAYIIFGTNREKIDIFKRYWEERVSDVLVYPQGTITEHLEGNKAGICRRDKQTGQIIIEMLGFKDAGLDKKSWLIHEGTHEFCHSFVDLIPELFAKNYDGIIRDGIRYKDDMGMIKITDPRTDEKISPGYYGKMFNETMMDIISSIAINSYDIEGNRRSINNIFQSNYNDWGNEKTGYSIFTSLTRLTIAAFSNIPNPDYDSLIRQGKGIFHATTRLNDGVSYKANDFLYGIIYDPLHIEEEFDKFMGSGSYNTFCQFLDRLFLMSLDNQRLPENEVKMVMNLLPDFLNRKMNYYRENNLLDRNSCNQIVSNFNRIWNEMQREYNAYFSEEEIKEIERRSRRNPNNN